MTPNDAKLVSEALVFAERNHRGQTDKAGVPYIVHLIAVAGGAADEYDRRWPLAEGHMEAFIVGILHDVVEDTQATVGDIADRFGWRIADAVEAITHRADESYQDYIERVIADPLARCVKLADLEHNLSPERRVPDAKWQARLEGRYTWALSVLEGSPW